MKLFVTGGAGFIGSNFIRYWLQKYPNDTITNYDKLTYAGHISSTRDFSDKKNYRFIKGDICNSVSVKKALSGNDWVINFAAETHVDRSIIESNTFIKTNIFGTYVLLESSRDCGIKRFHHVSTDEVFGSLDLGSRSKFNENTIYNPRSPYAASKAASDHLVKSYYYTYGLPATITNCSNNFGPYQDPEKFLPRMITNLINNKKIPIYGDGLNVRDWLYVEDHIKAIDVVLHKGTIGETYMVGGMTKDVSNIEIAEMLLKIFNRGKGYIKYVKDRKGHDRRYAVSWKKINKELGWEPKFHLTEWLTKTVKWYENNRWWWEPLKKEADKFYRRTGQI